MKKIKPYTLDNLKRGNFYHIEFQCRRQCEFLGKFQCGTPLGFLSFEKLAVAKHCGLCGSGELGDDSICVSGNALERCDEIKVGDFPLYIWFEYKSDLYTELLKGNILC